MRPRPGRPTGVCITIGRTRSGPGQVDLAAGRNRSFVSGRARWRACMARCHIWHRLPSTFWLHRVSVDMSYALASRLCVLSFRIMARRRPKKKSIAAARHGRHECVFVRTGASRILRLRMSMSRWTRPIPGVVGSFVRRTLDS